LALLDDVGLVPNVAARLELHHRLVGHRCEQLQVEALPRLHLRLGGDAAPHAARAAAGGPPAAELALAGSAAVVGVAVVVRVFVI
jgi:hypothetical protein